MPTIRASGFRTSNGECPENHIRCIRSEQLHEENPGAELFFLVGGDAFFEMDTWYQFKEIFRLAAIVVLCRPECGEEEILEFVSKKVSDLYRIVPENRRNPASGAAVRVYILRNTRMDISSTRIRELAAEGLSVRYLVPDNVLGYIGENGYTKGGLAGRIRSLKE